MRQTDALSDALLEWSALATLIRYNSQRVTNAVVATSSSALAQGLLAAVDKEPDFEAMWAMWESLRVAGVLPEA
ncbi:MAG TPA: hypothetical protein VJS92_17600 [Candidatus Polarisedimenticolaceae bacterium]|nr:hypothetical protein [Candidatus Polarisedimenticolaceae bacterium]